LLQFPNFLHPQNQKIAKTQEIHRFLLGLV
jgi:hypothetical protein